jgi:hypothetical protein
MGEGRIDMKKYSWIFGALLVLVSCTGDFKDPELRMRICRLIIMNMVFVWE